MSLFLVQRIDFCDYDETQAMIVKAPDPKTARKIARETVYDQERNIWTDENRIDCFYLDPVMGVDEKPHVIMEDFRAG